MQYIELKVTSRFENTVIKLIVLTAMRLKKARELCIKANWNSGEHCAICRHAQLSVKRKNRYQIK
jgi:hypothetical protein